MQIDLNSDLGEGFGVWSLGDDATMMDIVSTANIACGFHAGDPQIIRRTIERARERGVAVGAHPGYPDLAGFGRRPMPGLSVRELENIVTYQIGAFAAMCALAGHRMTHVKTHGALGNACADDDTLADAVARAIRAVDPSLAWLTLPGTATDRAAERFGLRPIREVYPDRTYDDSFNLTSRAKPGSVIHDPNRVLERAMAMVVNGSVESVNGKVLKVEIDSICVHADSAQGVAAAQTLRHGLERAGWTIGSKVVS